MPIYSEWQTIVPIPDITIMKTMKLDQNISVVQASLLLRCGDIEVNPGPLGREGEMTTLRNITTFITVFFYLFL